MELHVYNRELTMLGVVEKINSLIWIRRYWSCGEFKLLVPFTEEHSNFLVKKRLIMKRGDSEAGEIRFVNIKKNKQGLEEIEVQGKFITRWIGKRLIENQIVTTNNTQAILYRIVDENVINPSEPQRTIPNILLANDPDLQSGTIDYASEPNSNALLACEAAAKAAKLGFKITTDVRNKRHYFTVYKGRDLTADQTENPPCVFSQEFDNVSEQEFTNSIENLKTTAYTGGEELEGVPRKIAVSGNEAVGLDRDEVFVDASEINQSYEENGIQVTLTDAEYLALLAAFGASELERYTEVLSFSSKINARGNLKYKEDYDVGDRVTCVDKRWGIKINARITEITETYQKNLEEIDITFGESLPALIDKIRRLR